MSIDMRQIWDGVRANREAWASCPATHHQLMRVGTSTGRQKFQCLHCGGTIGSEVQYYIQGFEAAGGKADDVFPGWHS